METIDLTNTAKLNKTTNDNGLFLENTDEFLFKLEWKQRNQLIQILNDYIEYVHVGEMINSKELSKNKNKIIEILTNLELKLCQTNLSNTIESNNIKLVTIIGNKFKSEIIDQLVKNECLAIKNQINEDYKIKLIDENNNLIKRIIDLKADCVNDNNLINRKRKFNDDDTESEDDSSDLSKMVIGLEKTVINLNIEISNLKKQFNNYNSKTFNCILKGVKSFFQTDNTFFSNPFKYLDIEFKIRIDSAINKQDNKRYLEFYLRCNNRFDDENNINWQLDANYELRLKNYLPGKSDRVIKYNYTFKKTIGYGDDKFISVDDLFNLNNGFIKQNSINLEVYLKCDRVVRDI